MHLKGGIAHCFTGTMDQVEAYLSLGLYIGITGWVCDDKRGEDLRDAVKHIPLDRLILETDAPYLFPKTLRPRKRNNEPAYLPYIAQQLGCVAIGECGLDFNRNFSPQDVQLAVFEAQLDIAVSLNLPVYLHERDAFSEQVSQLKAYKPNNSAQTRPRPAQVGQQPLPSKPGNDFGLEHKRDLTKETSEITVTINTVKKNPRDKYVLTFSDGSVWQQTDRTHLKLEEGQAVSVERGLFGSFFLSVEGLNKRIKVKRVK